MCQTKGKTLEQYHIIWYNIFIKYAIIWEYFEEDEFDKRTFRKGLFFCIRWNKQNIEKLLVLVYDKPFGMNRKYNLLREKFRDYHSTPLNTKGWLYSPDHNIIFNGLGN